MAHTMDSIVQCMIGIDC